MQFEGANVVVTGAARGIGAALGQRFHAGGANVVFADVIDPAGATSGLERAAGVVADVSSEAGNIALIRAAEDAFGPIDLFFANAGIMGPTDLGAPQAEWDLTFNVNVNAHRWAAAHLLDGWLTRGRGYFCSTASAAGLLAQVGAPAYTVTKRAAVAFAEWLAITYGARGIGVSCLCPQGVRTDMLTSSPRGEEFMKAVGDVLMPEAVADITVAAIEQDRFLILPHPEVQQYVMNKATNIERWLGGMRKVHALYSAG